MRALKTDEKGIVECRVEGQIVYRTFTFKPSKSSESRYVVKCSFDFSEVSMEELMEISAQSLVISDVQPLCRVTLLENPNMPLANVSKIVEQDFDVRKLLDATPKRMSEPAKVKNAVLKLSAEDRKALLAQLLEMETTSEETEAEAA